MAITDDVKHQEELKNAHAKLKEIERQMHERSKFEHQIIQKLEEVSVKYQN